METKMMEWVSNLIYAHCIILLLKIGTLIEFLISAKIVAYYHASYKRSRLDT